MFNANDIINKQYGDLTVVKLHHKEQIYRNNIKNGFLYYYLCKCSCGNEKIVLRNLLLNNEIKHCGCKKSENISNSIKKHGMFGTRIYNTWAHMKQRCYNPKNASYNHYGKKGIKVCEEWQTFEPFYNWSMANGYSDNLSIDRIDVNGNYEPSNCRWATIDQQNNNKSNTKFYTINNKTQSVSQWAKEYNISKTIVYGRLRRGATIEQALAS